VQIANMALSRPCRWILRTCQIDAHQGIGAGEHDGPDAVTIKHGRSLDPYRHRGALFRLHPRIRVKLILSKAKESFVPLLQNLLDGVPQPACL